MDSDVVISIDVEWAEPEVLADTVRLLDEREVPATFFCTHDGIAVPGHERALHPNFRRSSNTTLPLEKSVAMGDRDFYRSIVVSCQAFCPEAIGTRSHSLITDSDMLPIFAEQGLEYDSSCMLPLARNLQPVWRGSGMVEIPIYYMDHWDIFEAATGLSTNGLALDGPGLKVLTFHPNLVFANAAEPVDIVRMREHYHDPDWLLEHRNPGRGVRTLFVEILDRLARAASPKRVLADVNADWRVANNHPASRLVRASATRQ